MTTASSLLEVSDLTVTYRQRGSRRRTLTAVDGVTFAVGRRETVALVGESGSGKSTVARAIVGLTRAAGGSVRFEGADITNASSKTRRLLSRDLQMVFQDPYGSLSPTRTVGQTLAEPLLAHTNLEMLEVRTSVGTMLERVGLDAGSSRRYPSGFSGGQRQRIAIGRALMLSPKLVVCDEPVSSLDLSVQAQILNLLRDLQSELGVSYVFITHDLSVVRYLSSRVVVLYRGKVMESGPTEVVCRQPTHPYTRALLAAAPVADPAVQATREAQPRHSPLRGESPDRTTGCRFLSRCPFAIATCEDEQPLVANSLGSAAACSPDRRTATLGHGPHDGGGPMKVAVETGGGLVGGRNLDGVNAFLGVPYGASTAGAGRFRAPLAPEKWAGVRDASHWGPRCYQSTTTSPLHSAFPSTFGAIAGDDATLDLPLSEDCLTVNVWTTAVNDGGARPVLCWLHGGGSCGSPSEYRADGSALARLGVVVVSVTHRLNVFGYLHLGEVAGEAYGESGCAGSARYRRRPRMDRDNISNFGGDPGNVTVFGESAGGAKVACLMAMRLAGGLFHKAAIMSGAETTSGLSASVEEAQRFTDVLLQGLQIPTSQWSELACVEAERLVRAHEAASLSLGIPYVLAPPGPTVGGAAPAAHAHRASPRGRLHRRPLDDRRVPRRDEAVPHGPGLHGGAVGTRSSPGSGRWQPTRQHEP